MRVFDKAESTFYNTNLAIPRYRASNLFQYDHVELTDSSTGNYGDFSNISLRSKQSMNNKMLLNSLTSNRDFNKRYGVTSI